MSWTTKGMITKVEYTLKYINLVDTLRVAERQLQLGRSSLYKAFGTRPPDVEELQADYDTKAARLKAHEAENEGMEPLGYQDALELLKLSLNGALERLSAEYEKMICPHETS